MGDWWLMKCHSIVNRYLRLIIFGVVWAALMPGHWSCRDDRSSKKDKIRHVILISIDTCRADHLSCYGYEKQTTPNIDEVARQGVLFEQAVTPVPLTLPAHTSMLSGTVPAYHGVHDNMEYQVSPANEMLAEILKPQGYRTAAFVSSFVLDAQFGMDHGFDSYDDEFEDEHSYMQISERRGEEITRLSRQWLEQHGNENFFLFLHYYDPHTDYRPPEPFASTFGKSSYDGEIAYVDHCIGGVLDKLKELGLYDSALIIITADHGEGLGEHAENEHSYFIYQSVMHVPLIIKPPHFKQVKIIKDYVGIIDIAPTILGGAGIEPPESIQGIDLSAAWSGDDFAGGDRYFLCESFYPAKYGCNPLLGIVGAGYKYIQAPRPELYHLREDTAELNNLAPAQTYLARKYRSHLGKLLNEQIRPEKIDNKLKLDIESIRRLESLGYVAGSVEDSYNFDPDKLDAKDFIDYHRLSHDFSLAMDNHNFQDARQICVKMVELYPNVTNIHYKFGMVALKQGRLDESIRHHEILLEHFPLNAKAHAQMGEALIRAGRSEQALHHLEKALELNPDDDTARGNLGVALNQLERFSEAAEHFRRVLKNKPQNAYTHAGLALALSRQNQWEEAVHHYRLALELEPNDWEMHTNLGQSNGLLAAGPGGFSK
jgi:arylsulfatase A-like enzyme/Flp pilus assembly protein TadD